MTLRWRSEFGGFLGLRPADMVGQDGITERDMREYEPPAAEDLEIMGIEAHFLGQYLSWDSHHNATIARSNGMEWGLPCEANWWPFENLDNAQTGIHDHMMWRKYGYGRAAAQLSVDIRECRIPRKMAEPACQMLDGQFPETYAGVPIAEVLDRIGMTRARLNEIMVQFTNTAIHNWTDQQTCPSQSA